ncbi:hypothetical protein EI94DRAFT_632426 [Lactarius quietus]|nr:hypothetical protein EI94DRAFT_632426 [Lactarius quietus]
MLLFFGVCGSSRFTSYPDAHTTKQAEGVREAHTPSLSPLRTLKTIPDPFEVLGLPGPWEIHTRSPESSESESDSGSDDGSSISARSPTFQEDFFPEDITPVDWGATQIFTRLADNSLGLDFTPSETRAEVRAVATTNPQARSLRAPLNHQDVHGRERPNLLCHAPRRHTTPQSYVTASETLVAGCLQDTCLPGSVDNASGPKTSQKMCTTLRQKTHPYGRTKVRRNYGPDDWLSSSDPKERTDNDDALTTSAVYAEEANNPLRAPIMRPVELPDDKETSTEAPEKLLYSGPNLGGWLTGTFDGVPKRITLDRLHFALPVPFPLDEGLLAF